MSKIGFIGILLFIFLVASSSIAFSQFKLGVKGGVNFATTRTHVSGKMITNGGFGDDFIHSFLKRPLVGVFGEMRFSNLFSVQAELSYLGIGYKNDFAPWTDQLKMNCIHFPIGIKYHANKNLGVLAGPYASFLFKDKYDYWTQEVGPRKKYDAGLFFGLDYTIKKIAGIGIKYTVGLTDVLKEPRNNASEFNRGIQVYTFYQFELGKKKKD